MHNTSAPPHGVMEAKGAYNKYAKLPAYSAALALPLFDKSRSIRGSIPSPNSFACKLARRRLDDGRR